MKWFIKILFISIIVWPSVLLGQTYFNMRYPPEPGTWGSGSRSVEVSENNYFTNRWSISNSTSFPQVSYCKIDSLDFSILEISSLIDTTQNTVFGHMTKLSNGMFVEAASVMKYSTLEQSYGVIKFDSLGVVSSYIDTSIYIYIYIHAVKELPNKDLVLVGTIKESTGSFNKQKAVLIKTDSVGHQIWKKTYKMSSFAWNGESIALCPDGGFIIGGAEINYTTSDPFTRPLVIKVDSNGTRQWHRYFGSLIHSNMPAYGITNTLDGGYAFVGGVGLPHWGGTPTSGTSPWVVGLNTNGNIIWADTNTPEQAVSNSDNYYTDIELLTDSSLIISGQRDIWDSGNIGPAKFRKHGVLAKYSITGESAWVRNYRHPEVPNEWYVKHLLFDVDPTPDGGFVAIGWLNPSNDNTQDTWMIKVDSFGCLVKGCEVTSVPQIESSVAQVNIYPNPASDIIHFDITPNGNQQSYELALYDMLGRLVLTQTLHPHDNTISVGQLKPGVYNYRLRETWGSFVVE
ncbi:MAG: T9SS type A sorting domain-containing protein [Salibacteraceae bacterium]